VAKTPKKGGHAPSSASKAPKSAKSASRTRAWRTEVNETGEVVVLKHGEHTAPNGDHYVGEFMNGKKHGRGLLNFQRGDTYEGVLLWVTWKIQGVRLLLPKYCTQLSSASSSQENSSSESSMGMESTRIQSLLSRGSG
jgi:hypothetical protein